MGAGYDQKDKCPSVAKNFDLAAEGDEKCKFPARPIRTPERDIIGAVVQLCEPQLVEFRSGIAQLLRMASKTEENESKELREPGRGLYFSGQNLCDAVDLANEKKFFRITPGLRLLFDLKFLDLNGRLAPLATGEMGKIVLHPEVARRGVILVTGTEDGIVKHEVDHARRENDPGFRRSSDLQFDQTSALSKAAFWIAISTVQNREFVSLKKHRDHFADEYTAYLRNQFGATALTQPTPAGIMKDPAAAFLETGRRAQSVLDAPLYRKWGRAETSFSIVDLPADEGGGKFGVSVIRKFSVERNQWRTNVFLTPLSGATDEAGVAALITDGTRGLFAEDDFRFKGSIDGRNFIFDPHSGSLSAEKQRPRRVKE